MRVDLQKNSFIVLNPRLSPSEREFLLQVFEEYHDRDEVWVASSGSSAEPGDSLKLVVLEQSGMLAAAKSVNTFLQADQNSHWLQVLPDFHVGGLSIAVRAQAALANLTKAADQPWIPSEFQKLVVDKGISHTALVPTQVHDLVKAQLRSPPSLKAVLVGGAALSLRDFVAARELGWPLLPSFGMTETSAVIASAKISDLDTYKSELPPLFLLSHVEVGLEKNENVVSGADKNIGLLKLKGPSVLKFSAQRKAGKLVLNSRSSNESWVSSDRVQLKDRNGQKILTPLGRNSDFIKIKGEGVDLGKLEKILVDLLIQRGLGTGACLVPIEDERDGFKILLVYESPLKSNIQDLLRKFNEQVMPFERISEMLEIAQIPRTPLGKLDRSQLKKIMLAMNDLRVRGFFTNF